MADPIPPNRDPEQMVADLREAVPAAPPLNQVLLDAWAQIEFHDEVYLSKGAVLALFATLERTPAMVIDACNVALALSVGDRPNAISTFEKLAKRGLEFQAQMETVRNVIIASTVRERANGE